MIEEIGAAAPTKRGHFFKCFGLPQIRKEIPKYYLFIHNLLFLLYNENIFLFYIWKTKRFSNI